MSYLGGYLGLTGTASGGDEEEEGPDPIPDSATLGATIPRIDVTARALDRLCEYLRP